MGARSRATVASLFLCKTSTFQGHFDDYYVGHDGGDGDDDDGVDDQDEFPEWFKVSSQLLTLSLYCNIP
jgi:hypothetical protein